MVFSHGVGRFVCLWINCFSGRETKLIFTNEMHFLNYFFENLHLENLIFS